MGKKGRAGTRAVDPLARSLRGTAFSHAWSRIWNRCTNPNADNYAYYGGRGVRVCERWRSFDAFTADMYSSWAPGLTIERIDKNGPYSPENCQRATMKEQNVNKRSNRMVTFQGRTQTISQWAEELGINYFTLYQRLTRYGWTAERAFSTPAMTAEEGLARAREARWGSGGLDRSLPAR